MILLVFLTLLIIGVPIAFVLGCTSLFYLIRIDLPLVLIPQRIYIGLESYLIIAVPLFILAGRIMNESGITPRIIKLSSIVIGNIRGGLAYIVVMASMLFAGITGVGSADTSAIGSIMIPAMEREGYKRDYAAAICAASGIIGPIIPPSVVMVIYGSMANVSIAKLFLGGFIPGILLGISIIVLANYYAKKYNLSKSSLGLPKNLREYIEGILSLLMPFIIIGGILSGVFTPTEAAAFSVFYALILGIFVTKELKLNLLPKILLESGITSASILMIIGCAALFGWILAREAIPEKIGQFIFSITDNKYIILLLINLFLLFLGTFMETLAGVVLTLPMLLPIIAKIDMDLVHFGVVMAVNLSVGLITPPLGVCTFVASSIARISLERIAKALIPFIIITTLVILLITYFPQFVLFLPNLLVK